MTYTGFNPAVVQDCSLQPWNEEVGTFTGGLYWMVYKAAVLLKILNTLSFTPEKRSNMTARKPPGTS